MKPSKKSQFHVPIFDVRVWVVVCRDLSEEVKRWEFLFGKLEDLEGAAALCCNHEGHFAVFFTPASARSPQTVVHEVFHLTHRIMNWVEANFDCDHEEIGALLMEYLYDRISGRI